MKRAIDGPDRWYRAWLRRLRAAGGEALVSHYRADLRFIRDVSDAQFPDRFGRMVRLCRRIRNDYGPR